MKTIKSWLGVYSKQSDLVKAIDLEDYKRLIANLYYPVGNFHSYNKQCLKGKTVQLPKGAIASNGDKYSIYGDVTIRELMERARKDGKRLVNYGNHFSQSVIGAILGGTHGFGYNSTVADSVIEMQTAYEDFIKVKDWKGEPIIFVSLKAIPLQSYKVTNCVCPLSKIEPTKNERAYAVLPYSGDDPICLIAEYEDHEPYEGKPAKIPNSWWRLKLLFSFYKLDATFPFLRRWMQKTLNFAKMKTWVTITDINDLDPKYDQNMGVSSDTLNLGLWAQKPTHYAHNMAIGARPEDTKEVIKFIVTEANKQKFGYLTNFIGVRELKDGSNIKWAVNYDGPRDAIDIYCIPKHGHLFEELLKKIESKFDITYHKSKTVRDVTN